MIISLWLPKQILGLTRFQFKNHFLLTWSSRNRISLPHFNMSTQANFEKSKQLAAFQAVDEHVQDNQVIGIGSGSTVVYAVDRIAQRVKAENLRIVCIPTSFQAKNLIIDHNLALTDLEAHTEIDVTIDGCDECDEELNLIKGGGGCHLQEKIVASASRKLIIIADYTKDSKFLGEKWKKGIPLEVSQRGWCVVLNKLNLLGNSFDGTSGNKLAALRLAVKKMGPVVTDSGNFIVDFQISNIFSTQEIYTPKSLNALLKTIPGILETGLFVGMANQIYFGHADGTVTTRVGKSQSQLGTE